MKAAARTLGALLLLLACESGGAEGDGADEGEWSVLPRCEYILECMEDACEWVGPDYDAYRSCWKDCREPLPSTEYVPLSCKLDLDEVDDEAYDVYVHPDFYTCDGVDSPLAECLGD